MVILAQLFKNSPRGPPRASDVALVACKANEYKTICMTKAHDAADNFNTCGTIDMANVGSVAHTVKTWYAENNG